MAPHTQAAAHTHTNQEAVPLPFQAFAAPLRSIRLPRSIVPIHEAGVSHAITATILRHPSGSKYTIVSKGMVHQSITLFFIELGLAKIVLPLFMSVCSSLDVS